MGDLSSPLSLTAPLFTFNCTDVSRLSLNVSSFGSCFGEPMEVEDAAVTRPRAAPGEVKADRKQLAIQFKAQHALVVAFFLLLL